MISYHRQREEYNNSLMRSWHIREVAAAWRDRSRKLDFALAPPAVAGLGLILYFCTLPFPVESWYIGLIGVVLILPWLTRRFN